MKFTASSTAREDAKMVGMVEEERSSSSAFIGLMRKRRR
jgi:hypothetical protein